MTLRIDELSGSPGECGLQHGRVLTDLLETRFRERYIQTLCEILRVERDDMRKQAARWLSRLPENFQEEIDGIAIGALHSPTEVAEFLYADIARATSRSPASGALDAIEQPAGPMCSSALVERGDTAWVARNCDWLSATLVRGTSCVVHRVTDRIPVLALGIRGDIDIDTGMNAEGLWVHLHTLYAPGDPRGDRTCISWLFWAREALETCATIEDLERFIESTERDRGVIVLAIEGKTDRRALFECSRSGHERFDPERCAPLLATNHHQRKHPPAAERIDTSGKNARRGSSTLARYCGLRDEIAFRERGPFPDTLVDTLASDRVEMRTPQHLRTIYSAVARPRDHAIWFASGGADGTPAASKGHWNRVRAPWT